MVKKADLAELCGQIIDGFEDLLEAKRITIPNPEQDGDEFAAIIYGTDYSDLQTHIVETLQNWGLVEQ